MKSLRKPWRLQMWYGGTAQPVRCFKSEANARKTAEKITQTLLDKKKWKFMIWGEEAPSSNNTGARPWRFQKFSGDRIVSFKSKENAEKRAEEARKQGFKPIVREEKYRG